MGGPVFYIGGICYKTLFRQNPWTWRIFKYSETFGTSYFGVGAVHYYFVFAGVKSVFYAVFVFTTQIMPPLLHIFTKNFGEFKAVFVVGSSFWYWVTFKTVGAFVAVAVGVQAY